MIVLESAQFNNVFLRMDGYAVTSPVASGAGTINCQFGAGPYEMFHLIGQPDGTFAIASAQFNNVFLRMEGYGVTAPVASGGGVVNCQFGVGSHEKFYIVPQSNGTVAVASQVRPGIFLRMDGYGVTAPVASGGGIVNCQFGAGPYEQFKLVVVN